MKRRYNLILLILLIFVINGFGQVEQIELKPDGLVFPKFSNTEKNTISPVQGQCIYNTSLNRIECFDGAEWKSTLNQIAFIGHSGPSYILKNNEEITVLFNRIYDSSNSLTNDSFTAPEEGFYHIEFSALFARHMEDIEDAIVRIGFGEILKIERIKVDGNGQSVDLARTIYMEEGEVISCTIQVNTGGPEILVFPGNEGHRFSGYKVGPKSVSLW